MKRYLIIPLCALAALAVTPVLAADRNRDHHGGGQGDRHMQAGHETGGNRQHGERREMHRSQFHTTVRNIHRTTIRNVTMRRTIVQSTAHRPANWNNRPRHFDVHVYQRNFTAPRRYHWHAYVRPGGWYAHRWTYGETVPRIFWVRDYWVNDWWDFGLTVPPYGYEWVRYGDDVLLINISTGQVLQVEYDTFD